ncbi:MAG: hypothetical protein HYY26_00710 [Acidobacteria bacterium]|nr:hypothetical protein [Acidobacteriota bacterium]
MKSSEVKGFLMRQRIGPALLAVLGVSLLLAASGPAGSEPALPQLNADFEPLRGEFNQRADQVRLVLLLDPT